MFKNPSFAIAIAVFTLSMAVGNSAGAGEYYIEPSLFPSSNILNALGAEFSPIFMREEPQKPFSLPPQSFDSFSTQAAMSKNSSIELAAGHITRSMVPLLSNPFERLNLEIKARSEGERFWYLFFLDMDWARCTYRGIGQPFNRAAFSMGEMLGFRVGKFMAEISLGFLGYIVPDAEDMKGWTENASFEIPLGVRVGYNISRNGAIDAEMRFPVIVGSIHDASAYVPLDMSVGYQHIIGNSWILRGALYWGVTDLDNVGREQFGMIISGKWVFF